MIIVYSSMRRLLFISFVQVYGKNFYNCEQYSGLCNVSTLEATNYGLQCIVAAFIHIYAGLSVTIRRWQRKARKSWSNSHDAEFLSVNLRKYRKNLSLNDRANLKRKKFFSLPFMKEIEIKSKYLIKSIKFHNNSIQQNKLK